VRIGIRPGSQPLLAWVLGAIFIAGCGQGPLSSPEASAAGSPAGGEASGEPATPAQPTGSAGSVGPGDPTAALTGRAVEGIATGGPDVVLRIGAEGFRLPGESIFDLYEDRVLSARAGHGGSHAQLIVRDLDGKVIREFDSGMHLPQTGIVRGDDVYFGGLDLGPTGDDLDAATDRGGWVARGDASPERILAPGAGVAIYHEIERSPDGNTVGFWRCGEASCSTTLLRRDGAPIDLPNGGLIAMSNEMALQIGNFNVVVAYSIENGRELWRARTDGLYYERYATTDGRRLVLSAIEPVPGGGETEDQLRVDLLDSLTGALERSVIVPIDGPRPWVSRSLSTDRYVAVLDVVLPNPDEGPHAVHVVDLEAGVLLDVNLMLGDVPAT
jgi:hypothetical protein